MYFFIKTLLRSLLLPPASPLLLALAGALLLRRSRRTGRALVGLAVTLLWLLSTPLLADALVRWVERYPALDLAGAAQAQAIVIIGGGGQRNYAPEFGGPEADFGLLERLSYGAWAARRTGLPILLSGAPNEARAMQVSLERDFGTQARWVENRSRDTFENARLSWAMLQPAGIARVVLVTSSTHEWRAVHEFRDAGFDVLPAPVGERVKRAFEVMRLVPSARAMADSSAAIYELLGEPARLIQAALGVREKLDVRTARTGGQEP